MGDTMLSCELCDMGQKVRAPKQFAAVLVFHALIHHGVTLADLRDTVRYVAPHGDDWPENVRWRLPGRESGCVRVAEDGDAVVALPARARGKGWRPPGTR